MPNFTKMAIKSSFLKLLNERPLNKITVRDIVEDCGINRNSFYYHYQDITALIEEIVTDEVDQIIQKYPSIQTLDECVELVFRFALQNKKAVYHIYNSANRDIYERSLMRICDYVNAAYLDAAFGDRPMPKADRAVFQRFFKCEIFGLIFDWLMNGMKTEAIADVHRLAELCRGFAEELIRRRS